MNEKILKLYEAYISKGLLDPTKVTFDQFSAINDEQGQALHKAGVKSGMFNVSYDQFKGLFDGSKKKEDSQFSDTKSQLQKDKESFQQISEIRPDLRFREPEQIQQEAGQAEQITETQFYSKGLSEGELAEKKRQEEEFAAIQSGEKELTLGESVTNTLENSLGQLATTDDRAKWLYGILTGDKEAIGEAETELAKQDVRFSPTKEFTDMSMDKSFGENAANFIGATTNALAAFGTSALQNYLTMGAGLAADMVGSAVRTYNSKEAEARGISVEELIDSGEADILSPVIFGLFSYNLERIGLKGVAKAIDDLPATFINKFIQYANAGGKEGLTEWFQGGVDAALEYTAETLGKGEEAAKVFFKHLFSKEGFENLLQGVVGGVGSTAVGKKFKSATKTKEESKEEEDKLNELGKIKDAKNATDLSQEEQDALNGAEQTIKDELQNIRKRNAELLKVANQKDIDAVIDLDSQREGLNNQMIAIVNSSSMSEDQKQAAIRPLKKNFDSLTEKIEGIKGRYINKETGEIISYKPSTIKTEDVTVSDALNRPVTLTRLGGSELETPLQGDMYVEGQQVVLEDADGNITEIGNVDEISSKKLSELGVEIAESKVTLNDNGNIEFEGEELVPEKAGIKRNKNGEVSRVVLRSPEGLVTKTLRGADAEEAAYQILLKEAQTPEQIDNINKLLEQDEEFQNELRQAEGIAEEQAVEDIEQAVDTDQKAEVKKAEELFPKVKEQVSRSLKALSKLAPNVKIIVHETVEDFAKAIGEEKTIARGAYNPRTKTIHINAKEAVETTVPHEVFHAVLLNLNIPNLKGLTDSMIKSVYKVADSNLKEYLDGFSANYDQYIQSEEKLAELIGVLAAGYPRLSNTGKSAIRQWLDKLAKAIGIKPLTDDEAIDFLNTVAKSVKEGIEITSSDIKVVATINLSESKLATEEGKNVEKPIDLIVRKQVGGFDVQYTEDKRREELIKQGKLVETENIEEFMGKGTAITSPDDMLAGTISIDGKKIFEGGGGVFFVTKYGDVWASGKLSTAKTLVNAINSSLKRNKIGNDKGKGYLVLAKGDDQKLISSVSGVNSSLAVVEALLDKGLISKSDLKAAATEAIKQAGGDINLKQSAKDLKNGINKYFSDPSTTTFEKRGTVVKDLIGRLAQSNSIKQNSKEIIDMLGGDPSKNLGKGRTPKAQALGDLVAGVAAEKLTKGLSTGDVYAVIEVDSEVEVVEDSHPSYPFHVRQKNGKQPKLHLLKRRDNGSKYLRTKSGRPYKVTNISVLEGDFSKTRKQLPFEEADKKYRDLKKIQEEGEIELMRKKKKKDAEYFGDIVREKILDRQTRIKNLINRIGTAEAGKAMSRLITKAGGNGYASYRVKQATKKIFDGLEDSNIKVLDRIIYARRIVAINENRKSRGMELYTGADGFNQEDAQYNLQQIQDEVGGKVFEDLSKRANAYFDEFNKTLLRLKEAGIISEEVYKQLKDIEYSPIKTIKYLVPDDYDREAIDRMAIITGVGRDVIMSLSDENVNNIITDSKWLLMSNVSMAEARIFENRMLNAFSDAINSAEGEAKAAIEEQILPNPRVGSFKNGRPKYKYDVAKVPVGFTKVSYTDKGQKKYLVVNTTYASQLLDMKTQPGFYEKALKFTGTDILRFFATSGNPLFIVGNTAVDFTNILFLSDVYSKNKLVGGGELAYDSISVFLRKIGGADSYNKEYEEFMMHGGAMDYLSVDGLTALDNLKPKVKILEKGQKALSKYGRIMSYLGESSEIAFRLAVYNKSKSNQLKKFKGNPTKEQMEDIMFEAAREARETIDFSQGGSAIKSLDKALPYLNAATQGFRKASDYAAKNPAGFALSMVQLAAFSGGLASLSMLLLLGGSDDEEEVERALNSISDYEKANYHIIFTGNKDENGEHSYVRIKKLPTTEIFANLGEYLAQKAILSYRGIKYDMNYDIISKSIENIAPIVPSAKNIISRNPLLSGVVTYKFNYDLFYDQPVFRQPVGKEILPEAEGIYDDKVEELYKRLAPSFGMSPKRTQALIEKIVTSESTNPTIGLVYSAVDLAFKDDSTFGKEMKNTGNRLLKSTSRKLVRSTNKNLIRYKKQAKEKTQKLILETDRYKKEQKVYNQIRKRYVDEKGTMKYGEFNEMIRNTFDPIDHKRYAKKYLTYIKNMNADRSILDMLYETDPKVQALMMFNRFGNSLDSDELKELAKVYKTAGRKLNKKAIYYYKKDYLGK